MYINPVLFGVLATLFVEIVVINLGMIARYMATKNHNKRIATKGGKYNG
jgi:hypothetical protein|nr:MAG TPA: hypothetical protein [Caudoviricetes sp.]